MKQPNGCSTPAPKSSAAKQWTKEELAQTTEEDASVYREKKVLLCSEFRPCKSLCLLEQHLPLPFAQRATFCHLTPHQAVSLQLPKQLMESQLPSAF